MRTRRGVRSLPRRLSTGWWVALAISAGPICLFGPGLIQGRVLFWGTPILQFVPWRQFALSTVLGGHLPLWNPLVGLGAPLLANYQSALLYPFNWIQALVGVAWGQALLVALHLVWAGAGMVYLGRRIGLSWLAAVVSAVAFSLSGYLVARSGFLSINASVAWVPWIVAAVDRLTGKEAGRQVIPRDRWAILLAVGAFTFQWLAGHAQVAWYTLLLALAWAAWRASMLDGRRVWFRVGGRLAGVLAVSFCLAAPQLLPTAEYMVYSQRATSVARDLVMTYSFWPWRLTGLLAPNMFGSPVAGNYWGYGNFWEDAIYVGVLPLCLAVAASLRGIRGRGRQPRLVRFLLGMAFISFVIALGKNMPVFPFLYDHVPTFALFQAPTRWTLWMVFALSLLAGLGVDEWGVAEGRRLYWLRLGTAGAVAVALGAGVASVALQDVNPTLIPATAVSGVWLAAAGILALTKRETPGGLWKSAMVGIVVMDLTLAGVGLNPFGPPVLYSPASTLAQRLPKGSRLFMTHEVEYQFKFATVFRFDTFHRAADFRQVLEAGLPNTSMLSGLASANNFDPILPARYRAFMDSMSNMPAAQRGMWLDALDVGLAATNLDADGRPVYDLRRPPGRAWFVREVRQVSTPDEALAAVLKPGFDPFAEVVIEGRAANDLASQMGSGRVLLEKTSDPNTLRLRSMSVTGGWLVVSAMSFPGWSATVDGQPAQLLPADYVLSALKVPAGEHEIALAYSSTPFELGLLLALGGLVALAIWIRSRWRAA